MGVDAKMSKTGGWKIKAGILPWGAHRLAGEGRVELVPNRGRITDVDF